MAVGPHVRVPVVKTESHQLDTLNTHAAAMVACLGDVRALVAAARELIARDNIDDTTTLMLGAPYRVAAYSRRHLLILAMAGFDLDCDLPGLGVLKFTLVAGWNVLDLPAGTTIQPHLNVNQNVLIRATDDVAPGLL